MRGLITLLILAGVFFPQECLWAGGQTNVLAEADRLIRERKYAAAFRLLDEKDSDNNDLALFEKKIHLAMNYSAATVMHQSFTFIDLNSGQTLDDYLVDPENFTVYNAYDFQINRILQRRIEKTPSDDRPYRLLADFYFSVYQIYRDKWFMQSAELFDRIDELYRKADIIKPLDISSLEKCAMVLVFKKKNREAIKLYRRIISQAPEYGNGNYGLAQASYMTGDFDVSLEYARRAIETFSVPYNKSDAALLAGLSCESLDKKNEALMYYRKSRDFGRIDFFNAQKIFSLSLVLEDEDAWMKEGGALLALDVYNIEYYYEMINIFRTAGKLSLFEKFFDHFASTYEKDIRVCANVLLCRAVFYQNFVADREKSSALYKKALIQFKRIFPPDHEVIRMIQRELKRN
ncbi:MAG TPA: hypothetical protein PK926_15125 [Spirochaetota bacterium]|nr:hypothetical protein [Spirochaetota bacterium]HPI89826.1 hypothetical protein [Spirochaetota bacterium]HPR49396.1 hypothetical protein [Spirochaetota bacterium]